MHGRKSGGGGRDGGPVPPPTFFQVGDTISNVPPPPPRFWGRMKIDIINVHFCVIYICLRFFFFLSKMFLMWGKGTPTNFDLRDFRRRWRSEKKVLESPPPPPPPPPPPTPRLSAFFGTCVTFGSDGGGKICMSPPQSASDLRPCVCVCVCVRAGIQTEDLSVVKHRRSEDF